MPNSRKALRFMAVGFAINAAIMLFDLLFRGFGPNRHFDLKTAFVGLFQAWLARRLWEPSASPTKRGVTAALALGLIIALAVSALTLLNDLH
jgi:hypothetical protein